ncbi:uncharacterized protein LOC127079889 [Lathyrus oleraceus]|uniref:uncharacterized protein LOC127079889 n=1 Tax=Pisum sativum TaxID=3888 RepID=UPI0021D22480|nr:uncharacterized protein LOC127079889 [Pisum sativum]
MKVLKMSQNLKVLRKEFEGSEAESKSEDDSEAEGEVASKEDFVSEDSDDDPESGGNPISGNGGSKGRTSEDIDYDSEDESELGNDSKSESESEGEIDFEEESDSDPNFDGDSDSGGSPDSGNIPDSKGGHASEVSIFGVPTSDTVSESEGSEQVQMPQRIRNISRRFVEFDMLQDTEIYFKGEVIQCAMLVDSEPESTEEALKQKV